MTTQGESAVLVLAAGAGTRMRSDTPKVLHPLAGRSMLAHSLHAIAKVAPQHLVVVLGQDHGQIEQVVGELAGTLGRSIDVAVQDQQLGTGHAVLCGLSALPDDFRGVVVVTSGDIPLLDADTLADLVAVHSSRGAAVTVLTTTLSDPTGYGRTLRTQDNEVIGIVEQADATPSQQEIREVNAGVYAFDIAALRSALSRLSADNAQQELYLTDVVSIVRQDGQVGTGPARRRQHAGSRREQPGAAGRVGRRTQPPHRRRPSAGRGDHRRSRHHLDRRRRDDRPRHRHPPRNPAARAAPASAAAAPSARTPH